MKVNQCLYHSLQVKLQLSKLYYTIDFYCNFRVTETTTKIFCTLDQVLITYMCIFYWTDKVLLASLPPFQADNLFTLNNTYLLAYRYLKYTVPIACCNNKKLERKYVKNPHSCLKYHIQENNSRSIPTLLK